MPLHLLGKKSWNVYNPDNIERVKRDEAQAKAREEEDERRMQEVDAERRIQILRGERPSTPPPPPPSHRSSEVHSGPNRAHPDDAGRYRKRRRLAGEDDTDRDIRLAREDAVHAGTKRDELALTSSRNGKGSQAPIMDHAGHINLFPDEGGNKKAEKNTEAEAEAAKKKQSYEDQYTMRFSNAAGFKENVGRQPWYSSSSQNVAAPDSMPDKDVWGNEDPRRKEREKVRMCSNDPLAAMKRGVRQLKATEEERKRWNEEKRKEFEALKAEERHRSRHHGRRRSVDSLEGFSLDAPATRDRDEKEHGSSRRQHRHHHRDRSRDRSHRRSHRSSGQSSRQHDRTTHGDERRPRQSGKSSAS
ncbi:uncharacterized protein N7482_000324 [Penicillium canariense]|uniref:CBF1-interacting co-repressor CIR N-terminal domain-containing protein n=1 Tax=Penicillium canariense TaxID=189055 RepID=A0A9W9IDQ9_9EURO|nr:uncharacterized protein N7482_000324 [Penicillium canariense]KAJ5174447.1 hypothetical protein N7482_000324 [Penicillium canariense]